MKYQNTDGRLPIGAVMVVGGGIGGIQAALDLANSGFKVYLVEKSATIGGRMAQLDKTFPTGDCATCIISPKLVECTRNSNIEILTQAEVEGFSGEAGRFRVRIRERARFVDVDKCNACGDCERACPVRLPDDFNGGLARQAAIHKLTAQAVPNAYRIKKRRRPPCVSACPLGQNAGAYVSLISQGKIAEAAEIIRRDNPLPLICGYVCHRPCEAQCQQARYGRPVSIRRLKLFAIENAPAAETHFQKDARVEHAQKKRIAVIGSGPAGLAAADWLVRKGYGVTIFEALPVLGGMMRVGIPDFRLPRDVLEREIEEILRQGVELKTGVAVGRDVTIGQLMESGYDAVFVAVGAQKSARLGIEGENLSGVRPGIDFIKEVNLGGDVRIGNRVAVIGAGNAAMDIARTALRLGAREVTIIYRRTRREMPADPAEVDEAIKEGVRFVFLTSPKRFIGIEGRLRGIECLRMELSDELDSSGRRQPKPLDGSEHIIECDEVILATGQVPDTDFSRDTHVKLSKWGLVEVDPVTLQTNVPGVFAGGDVVLGAGTLSEAIAAGRRAGESIHRFLSGEDLAADREPATTAWTEEEHRELELIHRREGLVRPVSSSAVANRADLDPEDRGFANREIVSHSAYALDEAISEANRCLACGACCECMECVKACQPKAIDHSMTDRIREIEVGAVIMATGCDEFDARLRGEFGFGRYKNVLTSVQFERMLSASGPSGGHIRRPSDGGEVRRIAFIQCVGSRDPAKARPYCSSVCCMASIKEASVAQAHAPGLDVAIFYTDIRAFGKDFDRYYERAKSAGVRFVRCMVSRVVEMPVMGTLRLSYINNGAPAEEEFDLVVLSTGMAASADAIRTARILGIELGEWNFCAPAGHLPVSTSREGVYVAGTFQEPKDIPETVTQASAAAAMAMELLATSRNSMIVEKSYPPEHDFSDEIPRIGVFVCHCGINIASVVQIDRVVAAAREMPWVVYAENQIYACADGTQERIRAIIAEHRLNRLVIASCSPRTHEALFRDTARECGLNPFLVEMANIRDQCSWVHQDDHEAATAKAIDLVRMAVGRAARLNPLITEEIPVMQSALVLGGGPSGMSAALSLANQGFGVHLVEKEDRLGGRALVDGVLASAVDELIASVKEHPLISIHLSSRLSRIRGHVGNFESELNGSAGTTTIRHGVLIIATGGIEHKPREYLYGQDPRVMTQSEFGRLLSESERSGGSMSASTIAMIQCVGSRNQDRPYCSRWCCTEAARNAIRVKELNPQARVFVFYRDMRTYGLNELYYQKAREMGVVFVRYEPEDPPEVHRVEEHTAESTVSCVGDPGKVGSGRLVLRFIEHSREIPLQIMPDLLVLSTGTAPGPSNREISELAKVPLNNDGFFLEAHLKLRPVEFASDGIFVCGSAHSPKSTIENMQQGRAAAGRAATILSRPTMIVGGQVSWVDTRKCVSCLTCIKVCPYGAPAVSTSNHKNRVEIQPAKCAGCGICAAECPARAIQLGHFTDRQVSAAIESLLETTWH